MVTVVYVVYLNLNSRTLLVLLGYVLASYLCLSTEALKGVAVIFLSANSDKRKAALSRRV